MARTHKPLLVSVRSGAAVSMPGMMETVLDVGLNAETVEGLIRLTGNPRLAWDSYRRLGAGLSPRWWRGCRRRRSTSSSPRAMQAAEAAAERELDHRDLQVLTSPCSDRYRTLAGSPFPADPQAQLDAACDAVFRSWDAPKAAHYRQLNGISDDAGTAVTVQTMVYGNAGGTSGAGVGFTRNPATGAREFYFDFQFNAQGEDVVAGRQRLRDNERLRPVLPAIWARLQDVCRDLETLFRDAQDFEFTVQSGPALSCCRRAAPSAPTGRRWRSPSTWSRKGVLTPEEALAQLAGIDLDRRRPHQFRPAVAPCPGAWHRWPASAWPAAPWRSTRPR